MSGSQLPSLTRHDSAHELIEGNVETGDASLGRWPSSPRERLWRPGQARTARARTTSAWRKARRIHRSSPIRSIGRAVSDHRDNGPGGPGTHTGDGDPDRHERFLVAAGDDGGLEIAGERERRAADAERAITSRPAHDAGARRIPAHHVSMSTGIPSERRSVTRETSGPRANSRAHRPVAHLDLRRGRYRDVVIARELATSHSTAARAGPSTGNAEGHRRAPGKSVAAAPGGLTRIASPRRRGPAPRRRGRWRGGRQRHPRPLPLDRLDAPGQLEALRSVDHDAPVGLNGREGVAENLSPGPQLGLERRRVRGEGGPAQPAHASAAATHSRLTGDALPGRRARARSELTRGRRGSR